MDTTATLIDNIWTNNVQARIVSGLVTVRLSDHLPIFASVGGEREAEAEQGGKWRRRLVNEARIRQFAERLEAWSFDEERALGVEGNVARFRNEFRDMCDKTLPWVEDRRSRRDVEKPWLDEAGFKELVKEKGELYSRKIKGRLGEGKGERLVKVNREVNRLRRKLKREYFGQRLGEIGGDMRATWEVLGEVLRGRRGKGKGGACRYFRGREGGVTDGAKIARGFCDFYCQVGPKLAARIRRVGDGDFLEYMGPRVEESLIWSPTTPAEVELWARSREGSGVGWQDGSDNCLNDL